LGHPQFENGGLARFNRKAAQKHANPPTLGKRFFGLAFPAGRAQWLPPDSASAGWARATPRVLGGSLTNSWNTKPVISGNWNRVCQILIDCMPVFCIKLPVDLYLNIRRFLGKRSNKNESTTFNSFGHSYYGLKRLGGMPKRKYFHQSQRY